jgi:multicomponent Na+:H+ antiporter subunit G
VSVLGGILLIAGGLSLAIAALGVIVLPDALARQHAATKAGTFAASLLCLGALLEVPDPGWQVRSATILVFLLATLPVGSHLLARAAVREAGLDEDERELRRSIPLVGGERSPNEGSEA